MDITKILLRHARKTPKFVSGACYTSSIKKVKKVLTKKGIQNEFTI